jgi:hypothetical protein
MARMNWAGLSGRGEWADLSGSAMSACYHNCVPTAKLVTLIVVFFLGSDLSVVTDSTSLITVPVTIGLGIKAHVTPNLARTRLASTA